MLLWTSDVNESHFGLLEQIKGWGYDGVELPVFEADEKKFAQVGKKLSELGLESTAVTVCTPEENPISGDAKIREAGLERLKRMIDMCAAAGSTHLCGPIHSALGEFSGAPLRNGSMVKRLCQKQPTMPRNTRSCWSANT